MAWRSPRGRRILLSESVLFRSGMVEPGGLPPDRRRSDRAIVLQLLRDDHGEWWTRGELGAELTIEPGALGDSLELLVKVGVVVTPDADRVRASPCARHLDALDLIGI